MKTFNLFYLKQATACSSKNKLFTSHLFFWLLLLSFTLGSGNVWGQCTTGSIYSSSPAVAPTCTNQTVSISRANDRTVVTGFAPNKIYNLYVNTGTATVNCVQAQWQNSGGTPIGGWFPLNYANSTTVNYTTVTSPVGAARLEIRSQFNQPAVPGGNWSTWSTTSAVLNYRLNPVSAAHAGPDQVICSGESVGLNGGASTKSTLFSEDFESYGDVILPSTGTTWKYTSVTGSAWYWKINTGCGATSGSRALGMNDSYGDDCDYAWDDNGNKIAWFGTPINATSYSALKMSFRWKGYGESGDDYGKVVYSLNGTTWTDLSATYNLQTNWQTVTDLDLSAVNGQNFYIGFRWINDNSVGTGPGFTIDDIVITGEIAPTYSWSPATGLSSTTIATPVASPTATTTYNLSLTPEGCPIKSSTTVRVATTTPTDVTIGVTPASPVCEGTNVTLSANTSAGAARYRLVLKSAYGAGWHGIQEIVGRNAAGAQQTLTCTDASSATYTDAPITGGSYRANYAFDGDHSGTGTSGIQWLTPEQSDGTTPSGGGVLPNTNWQNYGTFNPFPSPEWIEFSSPQKLAELDIYNGRNAASVATTGFKDYSLFVSFDGGTTWHSLKTGTLNGTPATRLNTINIEPTYTWKKGGSPVGTGKTLTLNSITVAQGGTYDLELGYGCATRTINTSITVNALPTPSFTSVSPSANVCEGTTVTYTTQGGQSNYAWTIPGIAGTDYTLVSGGTSTSNTVSLAWKNAGSGTVLQVNYENAAGCLGASPASSMSVTLPSKVMSLATSDDRTCYVNGSQEVLFYGSSTDRYIGAVNANGNDLGNVRLFSYNNTPNYMVACAKPANQNYWTTYMGRTWSATSSAYPSSAAFPSNVTVTLPFESAELTAMNSAAPTLTAVNTNDDGATLATLMVTKLSNEFTPGSISSGDCAAGVMKGIVPSATGSNANGISGTQYLRVPVGEFSSFFIHKNNGANSPLPITLTSFTGTCEQEGVQLKWITATETNVNHFEVYSSRDGISWKNVGTVNAVGNSSQANGYQLTDNSALDMTYYRLRSVDNDGTYEDFNPISVKCEINQARWNIYPIPASSQATVTIDSPEQANGTMYITDMNGRTIMAQPVAIDAGVNTYPIDVKRFSEGTYFIHIDGDINLKPLKFMKVNN